jgi:long-chain fatty acid transport protein
MNQYRIVHLLLFLIVIPLPLFAQTNDEGLAFLQFNLFNPGARALGMGGAFVGLADDASAALANPAGAVVLLRPEVSVDFSSTDFHNEIPWNSGGQTFTATPQNDTILLSNYKLTFDPQAFPQTRSNISFASFVYPISKRKFVVSGFYNEQTRFGRDFETVGFKNCLETDDICNSSQAVPGLSGLSTLFNPTKNQIDMRIRHFGISSSFKPLQPVNLGATLNISKLELDSQTQRRIDPKTVQNTLSLGSNDVAFSMTVGTLVEARQNLSIGAVYSRRPNFEALSTFQQPFIRLQVPPIHTQEVSLKIPDSLAFGFSYQPSDRVTINSDVVRVFYSQLMDEYYNARFHPAASAKTPDNRIYQADFQSSTLEIEDGTEYRIGGEYQMDFKNYIFTIRAGYWHEPFHTVIQNEEDHRVSELRGFTSTNMGFWLTDSRQGPFWSRQFKDLHNPHHGTIGGGILFSSFAVDAAYDYSENFKRFLLSSVFYFGSI